MAQRSWGRGEPLIMMELPTPEPRDRQVRVRVRSIGVNPVDWKMRTSGPLRLAARVLGPPPPVVVGVDFAGVVDAVGPRVTGVQVGDEVVGGTDFSRRQRGSYADTVVVDEDQLVKLAPGLDVGTLGALPVVGVTAWMSLVVQGHLQRGQRALVLGASGGVGQMAVQLARMLGAHVVGVCSTRNVELVRSLGADEVIDYAQGDPLVQARGPFQAIVDCVGSYDGAACRRLLGPGGRHLMVANGSALDVAGVLLPPFSSRLVLGKVTAERLRPVVEAVARGDVKIPIAERLPLAEAERAHEISQGGRLTGKIVLVP